MIFSLHHTLFKIKGTRTVVFNTLTWAWLKTVVMLKHPGHLTSMKKLAGEACEGVLLRGEEEEEQVAS